MSRIVRMWIPALVVLGSSTAMAGPRICLRQEGAVGVRPETASSVGIALGKALTENEVEVGCEDEDAVLVLSMIRVGASLRLNFRLMRRGEQLVATDSVVDARDANVVLPQDLWDTIHRLRPPATEAPAADTVEAAPAEAPEADTVEATPAETPEAVTPVTETRTALLSRSEWGWVAVGVGAALVTAASVTGGLALAKDRELSRLCPDDGVCDPTDPAVAERDIAAENDAMHDLALAFDILLPVGLVTAAGGVLLLTVFREESVAAAPWIGRDGGGVLVLTRF
jgi:hypothetical protein